MINVDSTCVWKTCRSKWQCVGYRLIMVSALASSKEETLRDITRIGHDIGWNRITSYNTVHQSTFISHSRHSFNGSLYIYIYIYRSPFRSIYLSIDLSQFFRSIYQLESIQIYLSQSVQTALRVHFILRRNDAFQDWIFNP